VPEHGAKAGDGLAEDGRRLHLLLGLCARHGKAEDEKSGDAEHRGSHGEHDIRPGEGEEHARERRPCEEREALDRAGTAFAAVSCSMGNVGVSTAWADLGGALAIEEMAGR
jgi:hypothetical protein